MGGMVSRPGSGHLPVRASARAFVRPRFASIRASVDVRPALPILNVSCACIRAALACPLSVDRDGFLSLSLSLTEGNAPPFGPIRGRQRLEIPEALPRPRRPLPGNPLSSRVPPRQAARAGLPVSEDISGRTPDTRQKSCGTLDQEPKRPPRQAAEVPHRQQ